MIRRFSMALLSFLLLVPDATADLPAPRFTALAPLGGNAGSAVEVTIGGGDFEAIDALLFDHPGLTATLVQPRRFKVVIAADVPAGTYDVWALGKFGISNPRLFAVSHGLKDVASKKPNSSKEQAQAVEVNSAINGVSDANGEFFRFFAKQGQRLTFDCQAQRLLIVGGREVPPAEMVLTLMNAEGKLLARGGRYFGNDPFLDYSFEKEGWYLLEVGEKKYLGGYPYRLTISDRPQVENVFPRAVEPGRATEVTVFGRNLGPGSKPSRWRIDGPALEEKRLTVTLPAEPENIFQFRFLEHPTGLAYPITCSTVMLRGTQLRPDWNSGALNAVNLLHAGTCPVAEAEPNDTREQTQPLPLPALVNGRFDQPGDVDWYRVTVPEGQGGKYTLQVYCERLGGCADPCVKVEDEKGALLAELDDYSFGAFVSGHNRDPVGLVDLQAARTYRIMVKDLYGRGGPRCQYVLSLRKAAADFHVMAWAPALSLGGVGNCRGTTVRRGGADFVQVTVIHEGVPCPVRVEAEDLPPGLHAAPCCLAPVNNMTGAVVLWADSDAPEWAGPIRLTAVAQVNGQIVRRPVVPCTAATPFGGGRPTRSLMVAVRDTSPFAVRLTPEKVSLPAGGQVELKAVAVRHWAECKGRITVQSSANCSTLSVQIPSQVIPPGGTEVSFVLQVPRQVPPGEYTLCMQGVSTVPRPEKADEVTVFQPCLPLTVTVTAPSR